MRNKLSQDIGLDEQDKQQLIEELQLAKRDTVGSARKMTAEAIATTVRPADSVLRDQVVATGITRELRTRSTVLELSQPVHIGSFYDLQFDSDALEVSDSFARCDQITMLAENRFEARFQFLHPLVLADTSAE